MMRRAQPWLGTLVEISISDDLAAPVLQQTFQAAFAAIAQIHGLMSFHAPDSDVSRINQAAVGSQLTLNPHTYTVIAAALKLSEASAGLFDIRVAGRLVEWGYLPQPEATHTTVLPYQSQAIAWRLLPDSRLEKCRNDWLDLGGIAKGYAVDQAILVLQQAGIEQACVNAGGDLRVIGVQAMEIAIRDPAAPQSMAGSVTVCNQAFATSASYFSTRLFGEQAVSALLHGGTGIALTEPRSISVRAPECLWADGLTKIVAASGNAQHACLDLFSAEAFIISPSL
ncbi:MAG: FAD:protein FMN transferase [Pseudomonadota bacterium]